ncbi:MAG: MmcQ/YjbR family DNA-binding protein [Mycobacterium sp.]|nr:MmcQ/YjbR family DNA-binding protein [Mycobacterium sp.]
MATWDDVASIVNELPLIDERAPHEWRVGKKLVAWERPLRASDREALTALGIEPPEGDILGVRLADEGVKFALIADEPGVYFTTPHFDGYPAVLIRLAEIGKLGLRELITEAWLTQAPKRLVQEFLGDAT